MSPSNSSNHHSNPVPFQPPAHATILLEGCTVRMLQATRYSFVRPSLLPVRQVFSARAGRDAIATALDIAVAAALDIAMAAALGLAVGAALGLAVGAALGLAVGAALGIAGGAALGIAVGAAIRGFFAARMS
ncbi:hypothetical protein L226DRAFT_535836 [Lentinus tigrinus ALCF2SS1-7]|uniref:uncharacterized protein n=1 Tax=Lentinus tigrinus ALCF2SS1-7 TaxID=1328758 RepID=UPI00116627B1|nr:hypothetical protein L226DRAFT_535836 [Lentinus tigrinus ALCF2SS1-7]